MTRLLLIMLLLVIQPPPAPEGCVFRAWSYDATFDYPVAVGVICQVSVLRDGEYYTTTANGERDGVTVSGLRTFHVTVDAPGAEMIAVYSGAPPVFYLPVVVKNKSGGSNVNTP